VAPERWSVKQLGIVPIAELADMLPASYLSQNNAINENWLEIHRHHAEKIRFSQAPEQGKLSASCGQA